ncbi:MAG: hypothetical protein KGL39_43365 [Patescibacteria group bacterium]|nr:hypothetical protein [Patescibacteria group bacterium]
MRGAGVPTADQCAIALMRACSIKRVKPLEVFGPGSKNNPTRSARMLAAAALHAAGLCSKATAARSLSLRFQDLAPVHLRKVNLTAKAVGDVARALLGAHSSARSRRSRSLSQNRKPEPEPEPEPEPAASAEPERVGAPGRRRFMGNICGRMDGPLPPAPAPAPTPAFAGSRSAGKAKPLAGPRPTFKDYGDLNARVTALREKTPPTPWSHVARITGKPELSLRKAFDPSFEAFDPEFAD